MKDTTEEDCHCNDPLISGGKECREGAVGGAETFVPQFLLLTVRDLTVTLIWPVQQAGVL